MRRTSTMPAPKAKWGATPRMALGAGGRASGVCVPDLADELAAMECVDSARAGWRRSGPSCGGDPGSPGPWLVATAACPSDGPGQRVTLGAHQRSRWVRDAANCPPSARHLPSLGLPPSPRIRSAGEAPDDAGQQAELSSDSLRDSCNGARPQSTRRKFPLRDTGPSLVGPVWRRGARPGRVHRYPHPGTTTAVLNPPRPSLFQEDRYPSMGATQLSGGRRKGEKRLVALTTLPPKGCALGAR